ncbi:hypothetical protein GTA08_BOTSDO09442 [Botryosphaeria dothidea]|uniref:Uncharacterized protein n=1 Tax=Botryosphaeria dothidea TaxID=55169 RepID=A0A8H4ILN8_9PEZI|nr:hypothetical protein GTA08_BOTSDO09442 [Botryosphaeria dothidea]
MLGTQEAIRQSQAKEKREEHRARRCNLIVGCVKTSHRSKEINGKKIVLRDSKLYIDTESAADTDESSGHPFAGYYLPYPDSEYEGLVSTITHVAPILNWIYIDKETYALKYGVRDIAQPHLTGPFDCTRQDRRLTFEDWEGFVAVEEQPMVWALYFDRDDNGLKGKVSRSTKVLEIVLTRQERKKTKEEAEQPKVTDKEKAEQAGDHQTTYTQGAAAEKPETPNGEVGAGQETSQPYAMSAAELAKLKIGETGPSSVSSDHLEGTIGSPTEPWGAASMWSNQEQQAVSGAAGHLAPFTPSSSIYGDDEPALAAEHQHPEESTPRRPAYHQPYVEDEATATSNLITKPLEQDDHRSEPEPSVTKQQPVEAEHTSKIHEETSNANAGAEQLEHNRAETAQSHGKPAEDQLEQNSTVGAETAPERKLHSDSGEVAQHDQAAYIRTNTAETAQNPPAIADGHDAIKDEHPHHETTAAWPDSPLAGQKTSPTLDFQISHGGDGATAEASDSAPVETQPVDSHSEKHPVAEKADASERFIITQTIPEEEDGSDNAHVNSEAVKSEDEPGAYLQVDEEAPSAPTPSPLHEEPASKTLELDHDDLQSAIQKQVPVISQQRISQEDPAPKTPEMGHADLRAMIENLPAWAALPDPYWDAAAETPRRSRAPIEDHTDLPNAEVRNFSRPQQPVEEPVTPERKRTSPDTSLLETPVAVREMREESAPPVTTSRDPYPVEDDPTSTDTSLVDASFTSRDEAADAAAEQASVDTRLGRQSTQSLEPKSTHSSVTLGEPALMEGHYFINSKA